MLAAVVVALAGCGAPSGPAAPPVPRQVHALPAAPASLEATGVGTSIQVAWSAPATTDGLSGYQVYLDDLAPVNLPIDALTHVFEGLGSGTGHYVQVQSVSGDLVSAPTGATVRVPAVRQAPSPSVTATTAPAPPEPAPAAAAPRPSLAPSTPVRTGRVPSGATGTSSASSRRPTTTTVPPTPVLLHALAISVAPGGDVVMPGSPAVEAGCAPEDFRGGERVQLTDARGRVVADSTLGACQRIPLSIPGVGAITTLRMFAQLDRIPVGAPELMTLHVGAYSWPVSTGTLADFNWSISVTADAGIGPGAVGPGPGVGGGGFNLGSP